MWCRCHNTPASATVLSPPPKTPALAKPYHACIINPQRMSFFPCRPRTIIKASFCYRCITTPLLSPVMFSVQAVPSTPGSTTPPTTCNGGIASALDAYTGDILWTFANPAPCPATVCTFANPPTVPLPQAKTQGPLTVTNGVVYYGR
jgi:hypothetical protein